MENKDRVLFIVGFCLLFLLPAQSPARAEGVATDSNWAYEDQNDATFDKYNMSRMFDSDKSIVIPGVKQTHLLLPDLKTNKLEDVATDLMVVQGFCATEDYFLITAYYNDSADKGAEFPSVIYVLNRSGKYLTTINLYSYKSGTAGVTGYPGDTNPKHRAR